MAVIYRRNVFFCHVSGAFLPPTSSSALIPFAKPLPRRRCRIQELLQMSWQMVAHPEELPEVAPRASALPNATISANSPNRKSAFSETIGIADAAETLCNRYDQLASIFIRAVSSLAQCSSRLIAAQAISDLSNASSSASSASQLARQGSRASTKPGLQYAG